MEASDCSPKWVTILKKEWRKDIRPKGRVIKTTKGDESGTGEIRKLRVMNKESKRQS